MGVSERIQELERKIANQKLQLAYLNDSLRQKNLALDALHYVWCDGGCDKGVHRWSPDVITKELVQEAKINTNRLISWHNNREFRKLYDKTTIEPISTSINDVWFYFMIVQPRKVYHKVLGFFMKLVKYG
jgi:hypothetical protein